MYSTQEAQVQGQGMTNYYDQPMNVMTQDYGRNMHHVLSRDEVNKGYTGMSFQRFINHVAKEENLGIVYSETKIDLYYIMPDTGEWVKHTSETYKSRNGNLNYQGIRDNLLAGNFRFLPKGMTYVRTTDNKEISVGLTYMIHTGIPRNGKVAFNLDGFYWEYFLESGVLEKYTINNSEEYQKFHWKTEFNVLAT